MGTDIFHGTQRFPSGYNLGPSLKAPSGPSVVFFKLLQKYSESNCEKPKGRVEKLVTKESPSYAHSVHWDAALKDTVSIQGTLLWEPFFLPALSSDYPRPN